MIGEFSCHRQLPRHPNHATWRCLTAISQLCLLWVSQYQPKRLTSFVDLQNPLNPWIQYFTERWILEWVLWVKLGQEDGQLSNDAATFDWLFYTSWSLGQGCRNALITLQLAIKDPFYVKMRMLFQRRFDHLRFRKFLQLQIKRKLAVYCLNVLRKFCGDLKFSSPRNREKNDNFKAHWPASKLRENFLQYWFACLYFWLIQIDICLAAGGNSE